MNAFDAVLVVVVLLAAIGGFRLGFVTRAISWGGLVVGVIAGLWLIPPVLTAIRAGSTQDQLFYAATAMLIVGAGLGQAIGLLAGSRLSTGIRSHVGRRIDQVGGALAGMMGVVLLVWLLAPAMATVPGTTARLARGSAVLGQLDHWLPPPPDATRRLRRLVGDRTPEVFDRLARTPDVGPVPLASGLTEARSRQVAQSTVRIVGRACALIQEGSGYVAAPDTIITNAHVVAGESTTDIETLDGRRLHGDVVAFDPNRDVAVIHVDDLGLPALPEAPALRGDIGAVFGYPGGGPLTISPARVHDAVTALGADIYDRRSTRRQVLILASQLAPGDSGAPLVNADGQVMGLAFAISPDRPGVAYALQLSEVQAVRATTAATPVGTGRCTA